MKKLFIIAVITFGVIIGTNAQKTKFGAKGGVNISKLTGDDLGDLDMRTSFHIGGVAEIPISDKFAVQPELLYSAQGAKESFEDDDIVYKLDYLNIPVMAKYYVTDGLSLEAGPQVGFLLSSKIDWDADGESGSEDIKDGMNSIDFGLNFGLGYKMASGLNFGARYNLGLSDIAEDSEGSAKNGVVQVSVGYYFN